MNESNKHFKRRRNRRGTTTVEFALAAPLLFLVFFASLEFSRAHMLRQTAENATYEGARRGVVPGATAAQVKNAAEEILMAVGAQSIEVTVEPEVITAESETVTVSIEMPYAENSWIVPSFLTDATISAETTLIREKLGTTIVP